MDAALVRNLEDSCLRFEMHRELKKLSSQFYRTLVPKSKAFLKDWQACKYCGLPEGDALDQVTATWNKIFEKAPRLPHDTVMYRAINGTHADTVKRSKTVSLDRYSSFAHSPNMAREFGLMIAGQGGDSSITIMCVRLRAGTPFAFLSGRDTGGGLSARGMESIDKTQGEVVLGPMNLKKVGRNKKATLCDGVFTDRMSCTSAITLMTFQAFKK